MDSAWVQVCNGIMGRGGVGTEREGRVRGRRGSRSGVSGKMLQRHFLWKQKVSIFL